MEKININVVTADDGKQYISIEDFKKAIIRVHEVNNRDHDKINEAYILLKNEVHLSELYNAGRILELLSELLNNE